MVLWFNLKSFAEQYFLPTVTDKARFLEYLSKIVYGNGLIKYDNNYISKGSYIEYNNAVVDADNDKRFRLRNGVLENDDSSVTMSATVGALTIEY